MTEQITKYLIKDFEQYTLFLLGDRGSGKSNAIKGIIKQHLANKTVDYVVCFSPTGGFSKVGGSYDYLPDKFIHKQYTEEKLKNILNFQENRVKNNQPSDMILIFDDMLGINTNTPTFTRLITCNRHYNIRIIFSAQYVKGTLNPLMRSNTNVVMLFKLSNHGVLKEFKNWWLYDDNLNRIEELDKMPKYTFLMVNTLSETKYKYNFGQFPKIKDFKLNYNNNEK